MKQFRYLKEVTTLEFRQAVCIGYTVNEAAEAVAREAITARKQLGALRQCENFVRAGKPAEAATASLRGMSVSLV